MKTELLETQSEFKADLTKLAQLFFSNNNPRLVLAPHYFFDTKDEVAITQFVCNMFEVNYNDFINIKTKTRGKTSHNTFNNKHGQIISVLSYVFRNHLQLGLEKIAFKLKLKSHSSTLWAFKNLETWISVEPEFRKITEVCLNTINPDLLPIKKYVKLKKSQVPIIECVEDGKKFFSKKQAALEYKMTERTIGKSLDSGQAYGKNPKTFKWLTNVS